MTTPTTVTITDRNETKALFAWGFAGKPAPRDVNTLDFIFDATEEIFEARRAYSLNHPCPVLSFVSASRFVDKTIYDHRNKGGRRMGKPTGSVAPRPKTTQPPCKRNLLHDPHSCKCEQPCPACSTDMVVPDYLVKFFTTSNPQLAAYLIHLNFKHEILPPELGTRPLFEFFESIDLLAAVEGYEKGNGGYKRLLGIHSRMSAIKGRRHDA